MIWVRSVTPSNRKPRMAAMMPSVMAALRLSGGLNAGTAFEMASVPVMASTRREKPRRIDPQAERLPERPWRRIEQGTGCRLAGGQRMKPTITNPPHRSDEQVGRDGEDPGRLSQPSQVGQCAR